MTQPIDTAYVEIKAKGEDETAREVAKALDRIAAEVKKLTAVIEKEFAQAGHDMESEVKQATKSIERDLDRQSTAAKKTGASLALAMKEASESAKHSIDDLADSAVHDMERIEHAAERAAVAVTVAGKSGGSSGGGGGGGINLPGRHRQPDDYVGRHREVSLMSSALSGLADMAGAATRAVGDLAERLGNGLANAGRQAADGIGTLAGAVSKALGPVWSFISGLGLIGAALLLTPMIVPLIAALSQLTGLLALLPGTIGVLVSAIAPLVIAFQGIGDAVSALASGDLKKIDKAMQNISPQARKFAVELFGLRDEMKKLKFAVQDAFFEKFNGSLNELVTRLLPTLQSGLSRVAGSLGELGAGLTDTLSSAKAISALNDLFATTSRIVDDLRGPLMSVVDSLLGGMKASLPFVERMFKALGDGLQKFADWLNAAVEDGRFQKWLEDAFDIAKKLWGLMKSVGRLIAAVFGGTADDGKDFLTTLTEIVDKWTEWFESPEGKKARDDAIQTMKDLIEGIKTLSGWLVTLGQWGQRIKDFFGGIPGAIGGAASAIGGFFEGIWEKIKSAGDAIGEWAGSVGQWFQDAWNTVTEKGGEILQWFQDLPGKIGAFLASLPGMIGNFFVTAFDNATYAVGYGIGTIVRFFIDLPGNIASALTTFWSAVTDTFNRTRTAVVDTVTRMWNAVVDWFQRLPGRVSSAVSTIVDKVTSWFRSTRDRAISTVTSTVNSIVDWFSKLPGRAANAISSLPGKIRNILTGIVDSARNIGRNIMEGIADGIRNGVNSAINAAVRAAQNILSGFWDALGIRSPSRVMAAKVGKPIMQGIGVGVEDNIHEVTRTIDIAVNRVVDTASGSAGQSTAATSVASSGSGGSITIQNLTIPISGTFDFADPASARAAAMKIYEALQQLQREYR